jgi:hypothetical protein
MGVHFTVTVDHDIRDNSLDAIRRRFSPLEPHFVEIASVFKVESERWRDVTVPGRPLPDHFYAPAGFSVQIGRAALRFHHCMRFSAFVKTSPEQDILRRFSRQLAFLFGQHKVLYAPCEGIGDEIADWMADDLSLADIESRLRKRSNPPTMIEELARRSLPELCYFIDEFECSSIVHKAAG